MSRMSRNPNDIRTSPEYKKQYDRDHKMVKAKFINHESQGATLRFNFMKYHDCSERPYVFKDGEVYDIPLMIYEHINNNCRYQIHHYEVDESTAMPTKRIGRFIPRFSFIPLLYTDETVQSGPSQDIITVESLC